MKTWVILTVLWAVLGATNAETDWFEILHHVNKWQDETTKTITLIHDAVSKDNGGIGEKVVGTLHEYEKKALNKIEEVEADAYYRKLTRSKVTQIALDVHDIFQELKTVTEEEYKQLSEEGRNRVTEICQEGKANVQKIVASIIQLIKE